MSWVDSENDKSAGFSLLPKGSYQVMVNKITVEQTKKKREGLASKGEVINVELDVMNDQFAGRKMFERYNVQHDTKQAQDIGRAQFAALCKGLGVQLKLDEPTSNGQVVEDWEIRKSYFEAALNSQLKDKVCIVEVETKTDKFRNEDVNFIKKYKTKETALAGTKDIPF